MVEESVKVVRFWICFEGTGYAAELNMREREGSRLTPRFLTEQLKGWGCLYGEEYCERRFKGY